MLRAARAWGARPTEFLYEWSEKDRGLAVGLFAMEETTTHGFDLKDALDEESDGHFHAFPRTNHVQAALDRAREEAKDPEPGTEYYVVDLRQNPEYEDKIV